MTFEMKYIFKSITFGIALLAGTLTAFAQGYDPDHPTATGVNVQKNVTGPDSNKDYTVTLETFAEGTTAVSYSSVPSDIILVLDVSSSMTASYQGTTRIVALKTAVRKFVQTIYDNAIACKELDPNYVNRIAIITYDRNATMIQSWADITTIVSKNGDTYSGSLLTAIGTNNNNGFRTGNGTRPDHGLNMALNELLDGTPNAKRPEANLTVLLFTDGYPTDNNATQTGEPTNGDQAKFEPPIANKTLYYGSKIKELGASLYTVGLITSVNQANTWQYRNYRRVLTMMDWLSSNYPDAAWSSTAVTSTTPMYIESAGGTDPYDGTPTYYNGYNGVTTVLKGDDIPAPWNTAWTYNNGTVTVDQFNPGQKASGDDVPEDGYSFIVSDNTNFDSIFKTISDASGGSASQADQDTQIRDVVSNSFVLPDDFDASSVTIKIWDIKSDASGWENESDATGVSTTIKDVVGADGETRKELIVEGFDFSADGEKDAHGFYTDPDDEGNWVGKRYTDRTTYHYAGKKIVISFKIKANDEATGGDGTNTNHPDSGVYLCVKDENGDPVLDAQGNRQYTKVTSYPIPNTNLPLIIKITKDGLLHGESATFEIHRCSPKKNADGSFVTNALGKPTPDGVWENWSKVILTNKGTDGAEVTKILYALDPAYVYEVTEDDWGWSYELTGTGSKLNTSEVEVNPFNFHNTLKEGVAKHAEAVTINHFQGSESAAKEEHYKSVGKAQ